MTEKQVLKTILKYNNEDIKNIYSYFCDSQEKCEVCPLKNVETKEEMESCEDALVYILLNNLYFFPKEEKSHLQHYLEEANSEMFYQKDYAVFPLKLPVEFVGFSEAEQTQWLLQPYEKPKFKMTRGEKELLETFAIEKGFYVAFDDISILMHMQEKGFFKDVQCNLPLVEIIKNAVIENEEYNSLPF